MAKNDPKWPKYVPKWPKTTQEWPKMTQNGPKITRTFSANSFYRKGSFANFFAFRMYGVSLLGKTSHIFMLFKSAPTIKVVKLLRRKKLCRGDKIVWLSCVFNGVQVTTDWVLEALEAAQHYRWWSVRIKISEIELVSWSWLLWVLLVRKLKNQTFHSVRRPWAVQKESVEGFGWEYIYSQQRFISNYQYMGHC